MKKSKNISCIIILCVAIGMISTSTPVRAQMQYTPIDGANWFFNVHGSDLGNDYLGTLNISVLPHNDSCFHLKMEYVKNEILTEKLTFLMIESPVEWDPETGKTYNSILCIPITLNTGDEFEVWDRNEIFVVTKNSEGFTLYSESESGSTHLGYDSSGKLVHVEETRFFDRVEWILLGEEADDDASDESTISGLSLPVLIISFCSISLLLLITLGKKNSRMQSRKMKIFLVIILFILTFMTSGMIIPFLTDFTSSSENFGNNSQDYPTTLNSQPNLQSNAQNGVQTVQGTLSENTTWSGVIQVVSTVVVPEGITLTIEPGTVVQFKHYRDYKYPVKVYLIVQGGTLKAIGEQNARIWFTSDASNPINGDWGSITMRNTNESEFKYVIVEFGELGIIQLDSAVSVTYSIIRWCNSEGLYSKRSTPYYGYNILYNNSYHDIALEQFNYDVIIEHNYFLGGFFSIHAEKSNITINDNYFSDYQRFALTGGMSSNISVLNNAFDNYPQTNPWAYDASTTVTFQDNNLEPFYIPILPFSDSRNYTLPYMPGSLQDQYTYIYDHVDLTREIETQLGENLSFGWSLEYRDGFLWRFKIGAAGLGIYMDFVRIDPVTQIKMLYKNDYIMNARGLAYDGEFFWVNDFSLLKIFKFKINASNAIEIYDSFDIPYKNKGGCMGMTTDGQYLYLISRDRWSLYKIDKSGNLINQINVKQWSLGNAIIFVDGFFWSTGGNTLKKWTMEGDCVGMIFQPAKDAWAITWDGSYLWTLQRTCEMWNDNKIYMINVLDDSLENFYGHFYLISTRNT